MILTDLSAILHQMIFGGINCANPKKDSEGKFITSEYIREVKGLIVSELFTYQSRFYSEYGDMVLCLDMTRNGNWRRSSYSAYKSNRKSGRDKSDIRYYEIFPEIDEMLDNLNKNSPWKVVSVDTAEGDDVILCLAKEFAQTEKIMIISSDKDMIQAQTYGDVKQYSPLLKKFLTSDDKAESMEEWLTEHVVLGDVADEVPKVTDGTKFSENFKKNLRAKHLDIDPADFEDDPQKRDYALKDYDVWKHNRKGEQTVLDIFDDMKIGPATLKKLIAKYGSVDNWVDTNPLYRKHYERNKRLVLADYIPQNIREKCIENYLKAPSDYNEKEFKDWFRKNNLAQLTLDMPLNFVPSLESFLW